MDSGTPDRASAWTCCGRPAPSPHVWACTLILPVDFGNGVRFLFVSVASGRLHRADAILSSPQRKGAEPSMASIIEIDGLTKRYASGFEALKGVDLTINEGEIFALLGRTAPARRR